MEHFVYLNYNGKTLQFDYPLDERDVPSIERAFGIKEIQIKDDAGTVKAPHRLKKNLTYTVEGIAVEKRPGSPPRATLSFCYGSAAFPGTHYYVSRPKIEGLLWQLVLDGSYYILQGHSQTGKTTLLWWLKRKWEQEGGKAILLSFQYFDLKNPNSIWEHVATQIRANSGSSLLAGCAVAQYQKRDFITLLETHKLLILLDEVQKILANKDEEPFLTFWGILREQKGRNITSLIAAGVFSNITKPSAKDLSPLRFADVEPVGHLTEAEVLELVTMGFQDIPQLDIATVNESIYSLTEGHPGLVGYLAGRIKTVTKALLRDENKASWEDISKFAKKGLVEKCDLMEGMRGLLGRNHSLAEFVWKFMIGVEKCRPKESEFQEHLSQINELREAGYLILEENSTIKFSAPVYRLAFMDLLRPHERVPCIITTEWKHLLAFALAWSDISFAKPSDPYIQKDDPHDSKSKVISEYAFHYSVLLPALQRVVPENFGVEPEVRCGQGKKAGRLDVLVNSFISCAYELTANTTEKVNQEHLERFSPTSLKRYTNLNMTKKGVVHFTQNKEDLQRWPVASSFARFVHVLYTPYEEHQFTIYEQGQEPLSITIGQFPPCLNNTTSGLQKPSDQMEIDLSNEATPPGIRRAPSPSPAATPIKLEAILNELAKQQGGGALVAQYQKRQRQN